jgi:hypothetical protein
MMKLGRPCGIPFPVEHLLGHLDERERRIEEISERVARKLPPMLDDERTSNIGTRGPTTLATRRPLAGRAKEAKLQPPLAVLTGRRATLPARIRPGVEAG